MSEPKSEIKKDVVPLPEHFAIAIRSMQENQTAAEMLIKSVMVKDRHYGPPYPGSTKVSLLKPGAELLAKIHNLVPEEVDIQTTNFEGDLIGHREVTIKVVFRRADGQIAGVGVGSCSTLESRYRWRATKSPDIILDVPVPNNYWDMKKRSTAKPEDVHAILEQAVGEPGRYGTKKTDDGWFIVRKGEKIAEEKEQTPDLADHYNTVLKQAKKRAFVDGVITAAAASELFTQDVENMAGFEDRSAIHVESRASDSAGADKEESEEWISITDTLIEVNESSNPNLKGLFGLQLDKLGWIETRDKALILRAQGSLGTGEIMVFEVSKKKGEGGVPMVRAFDVRGAA